MGRGHCSPVSVLLQELKTESGVGMWSRLRAVTAPKTTTKQGTDYVSTSRTTDIATGTSSLPRLQRTKYGTRRPVQVLSKCLLYRSVVLLRRATVTGLFVCAHEPGALETLSAIQDFVSLLLIARVPLAEVLADPLSLEIAIGCQTYCMQIMMWARRLRVSGTNVLLL